MPSLQTEFWLPTPLEDIWEFHKNPHNLVKISPAFMALELEGVPAEITKGATFFVRTTNKLFAPFFRWNVVYDEWVEEPDRKVFVDSQKGGPFQSWVHRHIFERGSGELKIGEKSFKPKIPGTWLRDTVEYSLIPQIKPAQIIAEKLLTQLFVFRKRELMKIFPNRYDPSEPVLPDTSL